MTKKDKIQEFLELGMVMIHLDTRKQNVLVPKHLQGESHARLNVSYNFDPSDLLLMPTGLTITLTFPSNERFKVFVPWDAVFAATSHSKKEMYFWPEDLPEELQDVSKAITKTKPVFPSKPKLTLLKGGLE